MDIGNDVDSVTYFEIQLLWQTFLLFPGSLTQVPKWIFYVNLFLILLTSFLLVMIYPLSFLEHFLIISTLNNRKSLIWLLTIKYILISVFASLLFLLTIRLWSMCLQLINHIFFKEMLWQPCGRHGPESWQLTSYMPTLKSCFQTPLIISYRHSW
jgi:hypothetical protein